MEIVVKMLVAQNSACKVCFLGQEKQAAADNYAGWSDNYVAFADNRACTWFRIRTFQAAVKWFSVPAILSMARLRAASNGVRRHLLRHILPTFAS